MGTDEDLLLKYRNWYETCTARHGGSYATFHYHLEKQLSGVALNGKRVLEVGCGEGAVSLYLALASGACEVVALDEGAGVGAPVGVNRVLKDALRDFSVSNLSVIDADIMRNSFPDESFEVIIANYALHHVVDSGLLSSDPGARDGYSELWRELMRLLSPGGTLCLLEFSRLSMWRWSPIKLRCKAIKWHLHPTAGEWISSITSAGLLLRRCEYTVPHALRRFECLLANALGGFLTGSSFVIVAEKSGHKHWPGVDHDSHACWG